MSKLIIHLIAAVRPNFMKIAPVYHALAAQSWCEVKIIHTGQHYDANMSDSVFKDLMLGEPDFHLGVGSGSHAEQTGKVMMAYEKICLETERPDFLVVVGDVNSTLACALVASKLHIPVAHLESGLRSGDRAMPEEINRLATDAICDVLWTPSPDADENLKSEGHPDSRIVRVGNIMIDSFELLKDKIESADTLESFALKEGEYGVVTLHRPSNVDDEATLNLLIDQLVDVSNTIKLVFTVHPRTRASLVKFDLLSRLEGASNIQLVEPLSYIPFMRLVMSAKMIITDSGGIQEETTYLNVPCLTLRENTERPITITQGSNRLVTPQGLLESVQKVMTSEWSESKVPDLWDGKTASRIVENLITLLNVK